MMSQTNNKIAKAWPAPAKLNLFLHVLGRRPDGYHELQTLFQLLDWGDEVRIRVLTEPIIRRPRASGRTAASVPRHLSRAWKTTIGGRLSSPVASGGKLFVAQIDAHTEPHALGLRAVAVANGNQVLKIVCALDGRKRTRELSDHGVASLSEHAAPVLKNTVADDLTADLEHLTTRDYTLEVVDGRPDSSGQLGALERSLDSDEIDAAHVVVDAVIDRLRGLAGRALS